MKIEVANDDLICLRDIVHSEFDYFVNTPAATDLKFRTSVVHQINTLRKLGVRLNQAIAKVYGQGCYMKCFEEEEWRRACGNDKELK
jgi:hypothetical protein